MTVGPRIVPPIKPFSITRSEPRDDVTSQKKMEVIKEEEVKNDQQKHGTRRQGGLRTLPFIIANEVFEKVASYGLQANMILYLIFEYHMTPAEGTSVLFLWSGISNFMPTVGAFLSDAYFGRYRLIAYGVVVSLLGLISLWSTSILTQARPTQCDLTKGRPCEGASPGQLLFLYASLGLMSIGTGGIRACSLPFGADQIAKPDNPKSERQLQSYFNWYYASAGISIAISVTVIVYVQQQAGWVVGFGVPAGLMFLATLFFLLGSSFYVKVKPNKSLFTSFAQVMVVAWKNRNLPLPSKDLEESCYYHKGSKIVTPTKKLRYLNKACLIRNHQKDLDSNGVAINPWNLCTIKQVEELKIVAKVLPIWSSSIMLAVSISQGTFPVLQASTMDRHPFKSSHFEIPAGSYGVFAILTLTLWVAVYDRILIPIMAKYTSYKNGFTLKQRMGIGLIISCFANAVAAEVERRRRTLAIHEGFLNKPHAIVHMSAMWLTIQYCLIGVAEAFNTIGQVEFYYSQFPKSMSSIGVALVALGMAVGNLLGSLIVKVLNDVTKMGGNESWLGNNLNKAHLDYYYWLLTFMSVVNIFYYFLCSWAYGSCDENKKLWESWDGEENEEKNEIEEEGESLTFMPSPILFLKR